ncbi:MAG TPA: rhamnogalacturonan acetylesterase [Acidobacteriaceae bacterium]|jgi:lysophospholipase L1-like esterase
MNTFSRLSMLFCTTTLCVASSPIAFAQAAPATSPVALKFDFSAGPVRPGFTRVAPTAAYSEESGYGYESGAQLSASDSGQTTTSDKPFLFSAKVPEGNYVVGVTFGDSSAPTTTTIKAESGRLMVLRAECPAGRIAEATFATNVRTPKLPKLPLNGTGREEVSLDQFDSGNTRDWDSKLTIEINSPHAALRSIEITSAPAIPTVFLAGDSTVTDRDGGGDVSWGQMLPVFFKAGVAVANNAQSGETLKSFMNALRLDKMLSQMKRGDYLFMQFAHNDSKASWSQTYVEAETTYKAYLKTYIAEARLRGATPVLVTAMDRGARGTGAPTHGHGGYPQAMREVATEDHVALIDLYGMSQTFYTSAGADAAQILADGTHSTAYGGYEFAKCIVMGIKQNKLDLANFIVDDFKDFDPGHPDSLAVLNLGPLFSNGASGRAPRPATGAAPGSSPSTPPAPRNPGPGPL